MDLDPCDILAKHQHHRGQWGDGSCTSRFGGPKHCLPYLLASDLVASEAKVARAYKVADWLNAGGHDMATDMLHTALADQ